MMNLVISNCLFNLIELFLEKLQSINDIFQVQVCYYLTNTAKLHSLAFKKKGKETCRILIFRCVAFVYAAEHLFNDPKICCILL